MRKTVTRRIRRQGKAGTVVADVQAVVSSNVGGRGKVTAETSDQHVRIVQRGGRTEITEG